MSAKRFEPLIVGKGLLCSCQCFLRKVKSEPFARPMYCKCDIVLYWNNLSTQCSQDRKVDSRKGVKAALLENHCSLHAGVKNAGPLEGVCYDAKGALVNPVDLGGSPYDTRILETYEGRPGAVDGYARLQNHHTPNCRQMSLQRSAETGLFPKF